MKIYYESSLPKKLKFFGDVKSIMLFGSVYTEKSKREFTEQEKVHEQTHRDQYYDCFYAGWSLDIIMLFVLLALEAPIGWFIPMPIMPFLWYYVLYVGEWLVRWAMTKDKEQAYEDLSFERHARYIAETWDKPCQEQHVYGSFDWFKFMKNE